LRLRSGGFAIDRQPFTEAVTTEIAEARLLAGSRDQGVGVDLYGVSSSSAGLRPAAPAWRSITETDSPALDLNAPYPGVPHR
jgi:hypothetical protein